MSEGYLQLPKDLSAVPLPTQLLSNEQTTQIKVAKLNAGTFYAFQLSARNACGETVSSVQWFQTQASTPAAPQPPRCTTASNTSLSLSWDALPESACNGSAVDSYVLQVSESGEWRVAHNDASTSLWLAHGVMSSAVLRGLRPNTTYAFRLCAHNAEGNSAFSTPVSFISFCCTRTDSFTTRHRTWRAAGTCLPARSDDQAAHQRQSVPSLRAGRGLCRGHRRLPYHCSS